MLVVGVAFRHTSVLPPEPHPLAYENGFDRKPPNFTTTCIRPLEVMIQVLHPATFFFVI